MNLLCISGTPRVNGNSEILLRYAIKPFIEAKENVRTFLLGEILVKPCSACEECKVLGSCVINDDMGDIYESLDGAMP